MPSFLFASLNQVFVVRQDEVRVFGLGAVILHDILGCDMLDLEDKVPTAQLDSLFVYCR